MGRCVRCNSCECIWDMSPCKRCDYPATDIRTKEQIEEDDKDYDEWIKEMEGLAE